MVYIALEKKSVSGQPPCQKYCFKKINSGNQVGSCLKDKNKQKLGVVIHKNISEQVRNQILPSCRQELVTSEKWNKVGFLDTS